MSQSDNQEVQAQAPEPFPPESCLRFLLVRA